MLGKGKNILFDVDVKGGLNIKRQYEIDALSIFVKAPSLKELEKRLTLRSTEDEVSFRKRVEKARQEMEYSGEFDVILVNDDLNRALKKAEELVLKFLNNSHMTMHLKRNGNFF